VIEQMRAFNLPPEIIANKEAEVRRANEHHFEVFPENWEVVTIFRRLKHQWRFVSGLNGARVAGLNYAGVESFLRMLGIKRSKQPEILGHLQTMEDAALAVIYQNYEG
jgi:hypothetical protein